MTTRSDPNPAEAPQEAPEGRQSASQPPSGHREAPEGQNGPQAGAESLDAADLRQQAERWRHKAIRRAIHISKLTGTLQAVTDLASEEITARTEWGDGYRAAIADLREVLREFGHPTAHNDGPSVAECAANDRAYWERKDAGEGQ
ncbi:hypothetical protein [Streptomyces bullii]|uniref:Excreted virulence factor EspC, type VII ESX diderm n=1 Tax=Streptomyces bullii TaxID=349910 RepID=A0ABW0UM93_9ACTN